MGFALRDRLIRRVRWLPVEARRVRQPRSRPHGLSARRWGKVQKLDRSLQVCGGGGSVPGAAGSFRGGSNDQVPSRRLVSLLHARGPADRRRHARPGAARVRPSSRAKCSLKFRSARAGDRQDPVGRRAGRDAAAQLHVERRALASGAEGRRAEAVAALKQDSVGPVRGAELHLARVT